MLGAPQSSAVIPGYHSAAPPLPPSPPGLLLLLGLGVDLTDQPRDLALFARGVDVQNGLVADLGGEVGGEQKCEEGGA